MLSKAPKSRLVLALALPLSVALPAIDTPEEMRRTVSAGVSSIMAAPKETAKPPEYIIKGPRHIFKARGENLNNLHATAYRAFVEWIEKEISNPINRLTVSNFGTNVRLEKGEFVLEYSVNLNPAKSLIETHRMVEMRGTALYGKNAKNGVLEENKKKIPPWQKRMRASYPSMDIHYEIAEATGSGPNGVIFHEAVLAKGAERK